MTATSEHLGREAARLLNDETLLHAFAAVSQGAQRDLVTADAANLTAILRLQQKAQVVDEVLSELEAAIIAMAKPEGQSVP